MRVVGFKLFYHCLDRERNGASLILTEKYVKNVTEGK